MPISSEGWIDEGQQLLQSGPVNLFVDRVHLGGNFRVQTLGLQFPAEANIHPIEGNKHEAIADYLNEALGLKGDGLKFVPAQSYTSIDKGGMGNDIVALTTKDDRETLKEIHDRIATRDYSADQTLTPQAREIAIAEKQNDPEIIRIKAALKEIAKQDHWNIQEIEPPSLNQPSGFASRATIADIGGASGRKR